VLSFQTTRIDDMDGKNTALHNVLVCKDGVKVPGTFFHLPHLVQALLNLFRTLVLVIDS